MTCLCLMRATPKNFCICLATELRSGVAFYCVCDSFTFLCKHQEALQEPQLSTPFVAEMDRSFESSGTSTVNKKHVDPTLENSGVSERTVPQCDSPWKWRCNKKRVEPSDPRREADVLPNGNHDNSLMSDLNRGRVLGQSHCTIKSYPLSTPLVTQRRDQISIGEYYGYGSLKFEDRSPPISPEHHA